MQPSHALAGVRISLASPALIRAWSAGEVTRPDTLNYLTQRPEPGGLFCERIFGPVKDWSCACGRYVRTRSPGVVCEKCGVVLAKSRVRRERMGHIELVLPVVHRWFSRGTQSLLGLLLDLSPRHLAAILACTGFVVTAINEEAHQQAMHAGEMDVEVRRLLASLHVGCFLDTAPSHRLDAHIGVRVETGGTAIRSLLATLNLPLLAATLRQQLRDGGEQQKKIVKRLQVVEGLRRSGVNPAWMVLDVLPVLPPDLRPLVHVGGNRLASSDLNTLYARVIHRNTRVRRFLELSAPASLLHYEQRLLQEACDALFDNLHSIHPHIGSHRRPLRSLTEVLGGKYGRFRRNLLGKRVDYSGRSVICVGLDLHLHQCGLPKSMALELFKPFVIRKLVDRHLARSIRHAKRMVERRHPLVWDQLAACLHDRVVLLNRAPTLHRLSIQAFEAVLVEGDAILLHPLVCNAFNADFDGDQMAVHLPLSDAAQAEARRLLLSVRNLRSPATGEPTIVLSQEIALGCFYLTEARPSTKQTRQVFVDSNEARLAYELKMIELHTPITVRIPDAQIWSAPPPARPTTPARGRIETTMGRLLFNEVLPEALRYRNYPMNKERLKQLIAESLSLLGEEETARLADALKRLGYQFATKSGLSIALSDMQEPPEKQALVAQGQSEAQEIQQAYQGGIITQDERDRRTIALWSEYTEQISQKLLERLDPFGTITTIIRSGATKAKFQQIRQLSGIRGLLASPSGRIIPIPVLSNYRVGMTTWEVFLAASGARKGFMDRSLNTAQSGYLTRKLVEVGMEVWTTQEDCGTQDGWLITNTESQALGLPDLGSRVVGCVLAESIAGLNAGTLLDESMVEHLRSAGISAVRVRSPFTCQAEYGICCHCYGRDLATVYMVKQGVAVGVIAGQSIGEPGTQLTMRTFHSGGIAHAQGDITLGLPRVSELFEARAPKNAAFLAETEGIVRLETHANTGRTTIHMSAVGQQERVYNVAPGQALAIEEGQHVESGTPLTSGPRNPKQLLDLQGREATARYMINEMQRVYRATGVFLNDKHIEVIVRQMLRTVQVSDPGDTDLLPGEVLDRFAFLSTNAQVLAQGGHPALACPVLLGLTRTALQTSSWIAAASFQETSRVLMHAALRGQIDPLRGFKERVVLGMRIPSNS